MILISNFPIVQLELERALSDMGKQFESEYIDADYSIDVAIPAERIAFEVDGPTHFTRNTGTPLGATLLKRRHLAAGGWTVLPINFNYVSNFAAFVDTLLLLWLAS